MGVQKVELVELSFGAGEHNAWIAFCGDK